MGTNQKYVSNNASGFKCEFCGEQYGGDLTRFQWHLAKLEHSGVNNICPSVPQDVEQGAFNCSHDPKFHSRKRVSSSTNGCSSIKHPKNVPVGAPLLITGLFNSYIRDILSSLMDDSALKVGICGVGGVGKTQVAKYVYDHLLQVPNKFCHVFWVDWTPNRSIWNTETVSLGQGVRELQSRVSKAVGVDLSYGDNEAERAAKLLKVLAEKKRCVVFLDDVWDYVSPQEVGIPVGVDQCVVVLTTRSLQVCRQFDCQRIIDVECLAPQESYDLYMNVLGNETALSELGKVLSKSIAIECGGLPLAITIMARNMRGIADVHNIRNVMNQLMKNKVDLEIVRKLRLEYDDLEDRTLQNCFFCCPLFVEDHYKSLVTFLVDGRVIKGMRSRREELDEAYKMVRKLQNLCLIDIDRFGFVQMNVVIERIALQMMEENKQRSMVRRENILPSMENWNDDLVRVSITDTNDEIESIPSDYLPSCYELTTLLLSQNFSLRHIGDSFFEGFPALKHLCLSQTSIESLPMSLYSLSNLTTLVLLGCTKLREIPLIGKLSALEKLDLRQCGAVKVPDDIHILSKLKYLDLRGCDATQLSFKILANLCCLQFLSLPWSSPVRAEEVACFRRLEYLTCHFINFFELNKYLISQEKRETPLQLHVQVAGGHNITHPYDITYCQNGYSSKYFLDQYDRWSALSLHECDNANGLVDLRHNFQFEQIQIVRCHEANSFCTFSPVGNAIELDSFSAKHCDGIEFLFSMSSLAKGTFDKLKNIGLCSLKRFERLFSTETLPYGNCFSQLRCFFIQDCPSIKQLFPLYLLPNLKNLEMIDVNNCGLLEEIFATQGGEQINIFYLPKLCRFNIIDLPELKSISRVHLICDALTEFHFKGCPKLNVHQVQVYRTRQYLERIFPREL